MTSWRFENIDVQEGHKNAPNIFAVKFPEFRVFVPIFVSSVIVLPDNLTHFFKISQEIFQLIFVEGLGADLTRRQALIRQAPSSQTWSAHSHSRRGWHKLMQLLQRSEGSAEMAVGRRALSSLPPLVPARCWPASFLRCPSVTCIA